MLAVLRLISLILIVVALMLMGADVVTSLEKSGQITVRSIGEIWALIDKGGLNAFNLWVAHTLPAPLPGWIEGLLRVWAWAFTGVIGVFLAFLFGRRAGGD
jgi:hypothetical protein